MLERVMQTSPNNYGYARAYAEMLERYRNPGSKAAYEKGAGADESEQRAGR